MKYALIVMLAVYLVTFGCNPKPEKEGTASKEPTVTTHTAAQTTPKAGPSDQYGTASHKAPATKEKIVTEVTAAPQVEEKAAPAPEQTEAKVDQWQRIAQAAATTVLALMHDEPSSNSVQVAETPATTEEATEPAVTSEAVTVLPCGKKVSQDVAAKHSPCAKHSKPVAQHTAVAAEEPELSEAMQKMVNATNNMVTVTRHLVIATQQMLTASKDVAVEVIDTGKDALDSAKPAVQNAVNEKEIIATVKEVVSATKEAFEATSEAISEALEAKEAQPAPAVTPQQ